MRTFCQVTCMTCLPLTPTFMSAQPQCVRPASHSAAPAPVSPSNDRTIVCDLTVPAENSAKTAIMTVPVTTIPPLSHISVLLEPVTRHRRSRRQTLLRGHLEYLNEPCYHSALSRFPKGVRWRSWTSPRARSI